eukprot:NODE_229_length_1613_cov_175.619565_g162_i0.p1 GENE.NODE_229_length_1613_cov_175.619565_g162_i0~~NODE_229_length_1613_cov_175.619565_g162_i0.p1  ORF type:complete len:437 (+),score=133.84 NODE_229_length_1613_cov_175.619565_g162_i0:115-1425(+)
MKKGGVRGKRSAGDGPRPCKHCRGTDHKSKDCPRLVSGQESSSSSGTRACKAITCMDWVPQGASHPKLATTEPDQDEEGEEAENELWLSDADSELENELKDTDFLFVCGTTSQRRDEHSLEVIVYDDPEDSLFMRTDIIMPTPPLDVAWLNFGPSGTTSMAVVGSMLPVIDIFDLDRVDYRPIAQLGGCIKDKDNYRDISEKKRLRLLKPGSHQDAVLAVAPNHMQRNVLATGSADQTIKLWDLEKLECAQTYEGFYQSEVAQLAWHPEDPTLLLSASLKDNFAVLTRVDQEHASMQIPLGAATGECLAWHPHQASVLMVGGSDGVVRMFETRKTAEPLVQFEAHPGKQCAALSPNRHINGLLATGSSDGFITLWDIRDAAPREICSKALGVGEVFAMSFNPNNPVLLGAGGSTARPLIWTITSEIATSNFAIAQN